MLLDEFFPDGPDTVSPKSESNSKNSKVLQDTIDSDEEVKNISDDSSGNSRTEYGNEISQISSKQGLTKTILPDDLQKLVKEALAELKPELNNTEEVFGQA